ncbi:MAG: SDR family oxidoreductase [Pseudomonadaceae bacterium]|jgi:NAD(P)-dependent dehydrogenase (short-subunit alcohol dehydrogenase family)|nr:SDR family oxidoreductase [Pseudomonadaceae bacterium]
MANIIITGANRGIGLALVKTYLLGGDRVFALCRQPQQADQLNELAASAGGQLTVHTVDMADADSITTFAGSLKDTPVDVLLNVAGIVGGRTDSLLKAPFSEADFDDWRTAFEVMTIGPFRLTQAVLPNLIAARGKVMTVSSQIAASTWPRGGLYAYGATKAAVNRLMRSLAFDLRDKGVTVALVHPGWVQTDMGGANAEITPQESAAGIKQVLDGLTLEDTGKFFKWNGEEHAW